MQVADRVLMVRLSPPDRIGEFFGIYGLVGKGSQVVGQLLYGALIFLLLDRLGNGAYQVAVLSLLVTMLIGLWLVWPVSDRWAGSGEGGRWGRGSARRGAAAAPGPDRAPLDDPRPGGVSPPGSSRTVRMGLPPGPGGADHRLERRPSRRPAEDLAGEDVRGHEDGGIAGSPRAHGVGIGRPTTVSAARMTSRTEKPVDVPRLQASAGDARCRPDVARGQGERGEMGVGEVETWM